MDSWDIPYTHLFFSIYIFTLQDSSTNKILTHILTCRRLKAALLYRLCRYCMRGYTGTPAFFVYLVERYAGVIKSRCYLYHYAIGTSVCLDFTIVLQVYTYIYTVWFAFFFLFFEGVFRARVWYRAWQLVWDGYALRISCNGEIWLRSLYEHVELPQSLLGMREIPSFS